MRPGVMEWWSSGVMENEFSKGQFFFKRYSNAPVLQHSNTPTPLIGV
jgi:hypothetical protein